MQVVKAHVPSFPRFPQIQSGERVRFYEIDAKNPAWFRGRCPRGIEGFFPLNRFRLEADKAYAVSLADYDATELAVAPGDEVELVERYGQWSRVRSGERLGWIPSECLRPDAEN